jgi:hypothetical protein
VVSGWEAASGRLSPTLLPPPTHPSSADADENYETAEEGRKDSCCDGQVDGWGEYLTQGQPKRITGGLVGQRDWTVDHPITPELGTDAGLEFGAVVWADLCRYLIVLWLRT